MTAATVPGAASGGDGPRRALVLSGGGIRVAYQAGAVRALYEAGLTFHHFDCTSGGSLNQAMLFSGQGPEEMARRWRDLCLADTISFPPLKDVLQNGLAALGDSRGMREKVLPALGVDFAAIRAATGAVGTFNVLEFDTKTVRVLTQDELDEDFLIAGFSLPATLPPVVIDGRSYLDTAFVQDANLVEAVRRGADEIWLVWCLGNAPVYRTGALGLYLDMLEMTACGNLVNQLQLIKKLVPDREVTFHLVAPRYPLPPDPDLYMGSIDNATLVDMGYADARRTLVERPDGTPMTHESLMQLAYGVGVAYRERLSGRLTMGETDPAAGGKRGRGEELRLDVAVRIHDLGAFLAAPPATAELSGRVTGAGFGDDRPGWDARVELMAPQGDGARRTLYGLVLERGGESVYLAAERRLRDDRGLDLLHDLSRVEARLHRGRDATGEVIGAGVLTLGPRGLLDLVTSLRATDACRPGDTTRALTRFGRFFLGSLWDTYARHVPGVG